MPAKSLTRPVFVVSAKRSPCGSFGGALESLTATDLGVVAAKAALAKGSVDPALVERVVVGNVAQNSNDAIYIARQVGLHEPLVIEIP